MTTTGNETLDWFINNPYRSVEVKGTKYNCKKGETTSGGCYKNGYIVKILEHKGKMFIQIDIYTSASHRIDVEERFLFDDKGSIKKWVGWNNINLLKMSNGRNEYMDMLNAIYNRMN